MPAPPQIHPFADFVMLAQFALDELIDTTLEECPNPPTDHDVDQDSYVLLSLTTVLKAINKLLTQHASWYSLQEHAFKQFWEFLWVEPSTAVPTVPGSHHVKAQAPKFYASGECVKDMLPQLSLLAEAFFVAEQGRGFIQIDSPNFPALLQKLGVPAALCADVGAESVRALRERAGLMGRTKLYFDHCVAMWAAAQSINRCIADLATGGPSVTRPQLAQFWSSHNITDALMATVAGHIDDAMAGMRRHLVQAIRTPSAPKTAVSEPPPRSPAVGALQQPAPPGSSATSTAHAPRKPKGKAMDPKRKNSGGGAPVPSSKPSPKGAKRVEKSRTAKEQKETRMLRTMTIDSHRPIFDSAVALGHTVKPFEYLLGGPLAHVLSLETLMSMGEDAYTDAKLVSSPSWVSVSKMFPKVFGHFEPWALASFAESQHTPFCSEEVFKTVNNGINEIFAKLYRGYALTSVDPVKIVVTVDALHACGLPVTAPELNAAVHLPDLRVCLDAGATATVGQLINFRTKFKSEKDKFAARTREGANTISSAEMMKLLSDSVPNKEHQRQYILHALPPAQSAGMKYGDEIRATFGCSHYLLIRSIVSMPLHRLVIEGTTLSERMTHHVKSYEDVVAHLHEHVIRVFRSHSHTSVNGVLLAICRLLGVDPCVDTPTALTGFMEYGNVFAVLQLLGKAARPLTLKAPDVASADQWHWTDIADAVGAVIGVAISEGTWVSLHDQLATELLNASDPFWTCSFGGQLPQYYSLGDIIVLADMLANAGAAFIKHAESRDANPFWNAQSFAFYVFADIMPNSPSALADDKKLLEAMLQEHCGATSSDTVGFDTFLTMSVNPQMRVQIRQNAVACSWYQGNAAIKGEHIPSMLRDVGICAGTKRMMCRFATASVQGFPTIRPNDDVAVDTFVGIVQALVNLLEQFKKHSHNVVAPDSCDGIAEFAGVHWINKMASRGDEVAAWTMISKRLCGDAHCPAFIRRARPPRCLDELCHFIHLTKFLHALLGPKAASTAEEFCVEFDVAGDGVEVHNIAIAAELVSGVKHAVQTRSPTSELDAPWFALHKAIYTTYLGTESDARYKENDTELYDLATNRPRFTGLLHVEIFLALLCHSGEIPPLAWDDVAPLAAVRQTQLESILYPCPQSSGIQRFVLHMPAHMAKQPQKVPVAVFRFVDREISALLQGCLGRGSFYPVILQALCGASWWPGLPDHGPDMVAKRKQKAVSTIMSHVFAAEVHGIADVDGVQLGWPAVICTYGWLRLLFEQWSAFPSASLHGYLKMADIALLVSGAAEALLCMRRHGVKTTSGAVVVDFSGFVMHAVDTDIRRVVEGHSSQLQRNVGSVNLAARPSNLGKPSPPPE